MPPQKDKDKARASKIVDDKTFGLKNKSAFCSRRHAMPTRRPRTLLPTRGRAPSPRRLTFADPAPPPPRRQV
jgi:hypothetical protein